MNPITVMLVDDLDIVRLGLRAMLRAFDHITVVAEASDGPEALELAVQFRPDVVLMDIKMLRLDGIEATRQLKAVVPTTAVIMMTTSEDDALVIEAVRAGAGGYLLKDASPELIVSTMEAVANGGILINAAILRKALDHGFAGAQRELPRNADGRRFDPLSGREMRALKLMAESHTAREIGEALSCAEPTAKKLVQGIITKLHASDRTHAVIVAMRTGLIS